MQNSDPATAADTSTEPLFLNPANAAKKLGLGRGSIYSLLAAGHLRARKCGNRCLIDIPHALAYLNSLPLAVIKPHKGDAPADRLRPRRFAKTRETADVR